MSVKDRRQDLWTALCERRQDTIQHLADEFGVSPRTIRYDIDALSLTYPIVTVRGRHGGGVKVADWYQPSRKTLCAEQLALLRKLAASLEGNDLIVMNSIISQFAP